MAFQKIFKGQTFPPNTVFPEHCYFEGCTFQASCKIAAGSVVKGCTFVKCCPKPYSNPNSEVKDSIVVDSTLEYVTIDKGTLSVNNKNTGNRVQDNGWKRDGVVVGSEEKFCLCYCVFPTPCQQGVSVPPKDGEKPEAQPVTTCMPKCNKKGSEAEKG